MTRNFYHILRIVRVFCRHGLDEFVSAITVLKPYAFLLRAVPVRRNRDLPRGERLCLALQELGPVFIKFGQVLSTRPDLLPRDISQALTRLQDKVPPFDGDIAIKMIEAAYGDALSDHFATFERDSTASASVAQVHYATLLDGTEVVVKVLRPGIEPIIERDLELLHTIADLADRYWSESRRFKPKEVVEDYDRTIHDELDLMREAANASQLRINFEGSDLIYVPEVYWPHCRRNVMVMERIYGIPIREVDRIRAAGIDLRKLAHEGVEIFFTQAFRDGFFHADMHPGNIFVSEEGQYRAVDFGIMGTLGPSDKRYLAENLLAFFNRDYHRVADAHVRAGWVPPDTRVEEFEGAIRTVCEPIFSLPLSQISFGAFLMDLFRVARRFRMPVQPQLVLLQKTILNIEGVGRQLYPDLDLWETAKPFLEKWMNEQIGPKAAVRAIKQELPNLFTLVPEIPGLTHQLMHRLKNDELVLRTRDQEIRRLRAQMAVQHRRTIRLVLGLGLVAVSVAAWPSLGQVAGFSLPAGLLTAAGLLFIFAALGTKIRPSDFSD